MACYDLAYEVCLKYDKLKFASTSLENKAVIYYKKKDYNSSLNIFLEVIDFNELHHEHAALISLYSKISLVYRALGRKEEATQAIEKSLKLAETVDNYLGQLRAMNNMAIYSKWDKKYKEAERYYLQSHDLAVKGGYLLDERRALKNLSILYESTGELQKSLDYFRRYEVIKDSILNETKVKAIAELEAKYEKKADEAKILKLQNDTAEKELEKKDIRFGAKYHFRFRNHSNTFAHHGLYHVSD